MQTYSQAGQTSAPLSQTLLESACAHYWGMDTLPTIYKEQWGKPSFRLEGHHFNLSNSGTVALCCLASSPVGVDIQLPRPSRTAFLDKVCTSEERQWLRLHGDSEDAFALLWAMKESYCKYTGRGLTSALLRWTAPLPSTLPNDTEWRHCQTGELTFSLCQLHGGMVAVCGTSAVTVQHIVLV